MGSRGRSQSRCWLWCLEGAGSRVPLALLSPCVLGIRAQPSTHFSMEVFLLVLRALDQAHSKQVEAVSPPGSRPPAAGAPQQRDCDCGRASLSYSVGCCSILAAQEWSALSISPCAL